MNDLLEAVTLSVTIDRPWRDLYEEIWYPTAFPAWATGLSGVSLEQEGDAWKADGPEGPVRINFSDYNAYGIMDHIVEAGGGRIVSIPLRVIANGAGAEVLLTLFRQPGMSEEKFQGDIDWVTRDLTTLKAIATRNE